MRGVQPSGLIVAGCWPISSCGIQDEHQKGSGDLSDSKVMLMSNCLSWKSSKKANGNHKLHGLAIALQQCIRELHDFQAHAFGLGIMMYYRKSCMLQRSM